MQPELQKIQDSLPKGSDASLWISLLKFLDKTTKPKTVSVDALSDIKTEIAVLKNDVQYIKADLTQVKSELKNQFRWILGFMFTMILMILGLYIKK